MTESLYTTFTTNNTMRLPNIPYPMRSTLCAIVMAFYAIMGSVFLFISKDSITPGEAAIISFLLMTNFVIMFILDDPTEDNP